MLCKTWNAREYQKYVASVSDQSSNTQTFTVSEAQWELYIKIYGTVTPWHKPSGSSVSSSAGIRATISVNGTQVYQQALNTYADAGTQIVDRMAKLENVPAGATITLFTNAWGDWYSSSSPETTGTLTYTVPWNTLVIIRKLIPQEIKEIWQQTAATSYWNVDWQRYGEFDWEIHSSATTWAITPWNCIGFKVIIDSSGNRYKIPIYNL